MKGAETTLYAFERGRCSLPSPPSENDEPLPPCSPCQTTMPIGTLGPSIASDVSNLASMIGALRSCSTSIARGKYSHLNEAGKMEMLERERTAVARNEKTFGKKPSLDGLAEPPGVQYNEAPIRPGAIWRDPAT